GGRAAEDSRRTAEDSRRTAEDSRRTTDELCERRCARRQAVGSRSCTANSRSPPHVMATLHMIIIRSLRLIVISFISDGLSSYWGLRFVIYLDRDYYLC